MISDRVLEQAEKVKKENKELSELIKDEIEELTIEYFDNFKDIYGIFIVCDAIRFYDIFEVLDEDNYNNLIEKYKLDKEYCNKINYKIIIKEVNYIGIDLEDIFPPPENWRLIREYNNNLYLLFQLHRTHLNINPYLNSVLLTRENTLKKYDKADKICIFN